MNAADHHGPPRIDAWMARFDVSARHELAVAVPPETAYAALRRTDFAASPTVRILFAARGLVAPGRRRTYRIDDFVAVGFTLLEEVPGQEIVLGVTGRFWRPTGEVLRLAADDFATFAEPGWAQAVWSFRVAGAEDGSRVSTETRVRTTDARAYRAFRRYWRVVGPFSGLVRRRILRLVAAEAMRSPRPDPQ
jgi:hypothetical protein